MNIGGVRVHSSVTVDRVTAAAMRQIRDLDSPGICVSCGEEQDGCEPDAREYECESCGKSAVYGASELLMYMV